jgi:large subunit ribosomal protein L13
MQNIIQEDYTVINATDSIIGRLASNVAKRLLEGENIIIVNAEKGLLSGDPGFLAQKYLKRYHIKTKSNPLKGPFFPRKPDQILKRTVRGMLPYKKSKGKEAYKRLKVFCDVPHMFQDKTIEVLESTQKNNPKASYITLEELYKKI